jgi:hypothetical protein
VIRYEILRHIQYGKIGEFLSLQEKKNAILQANGLKPFTILCPAFGGLHHITIECDYESIEEYAAQSRAWEGLSELGPINGAMIELVVPGTAEDRLRKTQLVPGGALDAS